MSLPTKNNLLSMNFAFNGEPFVQVAANDIIAINTMNFAYDAEPFYGNINTTTVTSNIKTINGLAIASVKTINGLAIASVKTINGLA